VFCVTAELTVQAYCKIVLHNVDVQDHRLCSGTRHVRTGCRYILLVFFFWVRATCLHDTRCLQLTR